MGSDHPHNQAVEFLRESLQQRSKEKSYKKIKE